jgi:hypothetical protein
VRRVIGPHAAMEKQDEILREPSLSIVFRTAMQLRLTSDKGMYVLEHLGLV